MCCVLFATGEAKIALFYFIIKLDMVSQKGTSIKYMNCAEHKVAKNMRVTKG